MPRQRRGTRARSIQGDGFGHEGKSDWDDAPHFSAEAQQTFTPGSRVYHVNLGPSQEGENGTYLGRDGSEAIVEWDYKHEVRRVSFADIRNLYR